MVTVLVVDDSAVDRHLAGGLLKKRAGLTPVFAANGVDALERLREDPADIVVTDLQMPEMDGLSLVEAVRAEFPGIPVVLMTAHGSEEIAVRALQKGAASYVPKRNLAKELAPTVTSVLEIAKRDLSQRLLQDCLIQTESRFSLPNDVEAIAPLVGHLEDAFARSMPRDRTEFVQVAVALREALVNAIEHGNLELSSELREEDYAAYAALAAERRAAAPYSARRVSVTVTETRDRVSYVVTDEGPGFDLSNLPDPTDPANLEKTSGRGLLLIRMFMDEVRHNERGNQITMVKRW
jgi:CheY-like chemotaxis protein